MAFPFQFKAARKVARVLSYRTPHVPAIFALTAFISCAAVAGDAPLTLTRAQQLALAHSRQLPAQDMAVAASRDMAVAASQLPDPILRFGLDNLPVNGTDRFSATADFMTMRRVGIEQELTRPDKRRLRGERYEREADRSQAQKAIVAANIERDTALAWLDRYYAEQAAILVAEQAAQGRLEVEAAVGAYRGGRGTQADILAARSALAAIDDRASEASRRVRNAQTMLARWTGASPDAPLDGKPSVDTIRLDPASLDNALSHHPEIDVWNKQVAIAEVDARLAQASKQPDWSVEIAFQQRGPAYSNMVSIGVSLPLQWDQKHRQDRELSSKLATVEQSKAERDEMLRQHVAETRALIEEWQNDRERSLRYKRELIPLAAQRIDAVLAAYRGGKAGIVDLLNARRGEIDTRIQALQLQADTARLWAQLNFLSPSHDEGFVAPQISKDSQ
ncbi:MAG TPA: TolC family protein [Burkholderiaceae bacterium]|jgi:outer membrane protein TolC